MKFSVIIPIYKVEQYLRPCIDSVLAQTYTDLEIILVELKYIGADIAAKVASVFYHVFQVHSKSGFLTLTEEVMEDAKTLYGV